VTARGHTDTQRIKALADLLRSVALTPAGADHFVRIGCGVLQDRTGPDPRPMIGRVVSATIHMPKLASHASYTSTDDPSPDYEGGPRHDPLEPHYHDDSLEALRAALDNVIDREPERREEERRKEAQVTEAAPAAAV